MDKFKSYTMKRKSSNSIKLYNEQYPVSSLIINTNDGCGHRSGGCGVKLASKFPQRVKAVKQINRLAMQRQLMNVQIG